MRRTLFVFPRDLLPAAWGAPRARVAGQELRKIAKDVVAAGLADDGDAWLDGRRGSRSLAVLARPTACRAKELRRAVPDARRQGRRSSPGTKWGGAVPHRPAGARLARRRGRRSCAAATPATGGSPGRPWTPMAAWLGAAPQPLPEAEGYAELVAPLAVDVRPRHRGRPGLVARGDQGAPYAVRWPTSRPSRSPSTAAAPAGCCPTTTTRPSPSPSRGRRCCRSSTRRRWAGATATSTSTPTDTPYLFDSNGNGGTTAWWNGRDRRLLGAGRRRPGASSCRAATLPRAPGRARRRGRAAHRLARRRDDQQRLQLAADEVRPAALTLP